MKTKIKAFAILLVFLASCSYVQAQIIHPWKGKKVAYIGDSITDPRLKQAKTKWWGFLEEWLDLTSYVYGISGRQWNDAINQANKLKAEHGDDVDAIFIYLGTNDYCHGVPIGEWYTETDAEVYAAQGQPKKMEKRKQRHFIFGNETFKGRINMALDSIKRMYPTKQIVMLTPLHRGRAYFNEKNWQPTEDYTNWCGEYLDPYVDAIKEAGEIWSIPVIDIHALSGLYPMHEVQNTFGHANDRLHPNDEGMKRMAKTIYYQLLALPCTFD